MCGIAGIVRADAGRPVTEAALRRMARALRHRGPDGFGLALGNGAGLVCTRLAIVDRPRGWQPMRSDTGGTVIVYNGEVYNHPELRAELSQGGFEFHTAGDTEVVLRLLERDGLHALRRFNGQFALAWWQPAARRLVLVRDRFGVRPLHYAVLRDGTLIFGSEAKALFASGEVFAEPDLAGIDEVFTLWAARPPRTAFRGVRQLPPGSLLMWEGGEVVAERRWWRADYQARYDVDRELEPLLRDSVAMRLRADVPVGSYLSGGLDSSLLTALACDASDHQLHSFSVAFEDPRYDERLWQERAAAELGTVHCVVEVTARDIAGAFPEVIRHAETPVVRTAPAPLWLLARVTREHGIPAVVTGEGADELFWGYELFKEVVLRKLGERDPARARALLDQLYPYLAPSATRRGPAWQRFFLNAGQQADPLFSHQTRAAATAAVKAFYLPDVANELAQVDPLDRLRAELPEAFSRWSALERAAYLEIETLLSPYILAAQGDRVTMAHGVEGRYPLLDDRVFAHSAAMVAEQKLDGLRDKVALRELASRVLPPPFAARPKQAYQAPEVTPFFEDSRPPWVKERLSPAALARTGIFDARLVAGLVRRCQAGRANAREGMALVGILSTQLWHELFCDASGAQAPLETAEPQMRLILEPSPRGAQA